MISTRIRGIFWKLLFSFAFLGLFLSSVVLLVTVQGAQSALRDQNSEDMAALVGRTNQYLDLYFQSIQSTLFQLSNAISSVRSPNSDSYRAFLSAVSQASIDIVSGVYLVAGDQRTVAGNQLIHDIVGHPHLELLRSISLESPFETQWRGPYYSPLVTSRTVAFFRNTVLYDGTTAALVIESNLEQLERTLSSFLSGPGQTFVILTPTLETVVFGDGGGIVPTEAAPVPAAVTDEFKAILSGMRVGLNRTSWSEQGLTVTRGFPTSLGWTLFILVDDDVYRRRITELYRRFGVIAIVFFLLLSIGMVFLSRHFSLPIHRLAVAMDVSRDVRTTHVPSTDREDEIGLLYRSFGRMIERLRDLDRQRETESRTRQSLELRLLHAQVRPHFIGNTLACIVSLARQDRRDEVVEMLRSLILLMTTTADQVDQITTLEEEVACFEAYTHIQQMRFGNRIQCQIDIAPECRHSRVPKLLIEPLAENAFRYAFCDEERSGRIVLQARCIENVLVLSLSDDGAGIAAHRLAEIKATLQSPEVFASSSTGTTSTGIGLKNTHERLRLIFGASSGIEIDSELGRGTIVTLRVSQG